MLFGQKNIESDKNGPITVRYSFGKPGLFVGGYDQSTDYTHIMWRRAIKHVPRRAAIKNVLMLGLGGGSAVPEFSKRFPGCALTVVEWDPAMIKLYRELYPHHPASHIIEGDALKVVPALTEKFDLVIVDLFKGSVTPPELADVPMITAIKNVMAPNGYCILNGFKTPGLGAAFARELAQTSDWTFKYNHLYLYR